VKFNNLNRKKIIFFIFFCLPGGFVLLSIMLFFDEFILKGKNEK